MRLDYIAAMGWKTGWDATGLWRGSSNILVEQFIRILRPDDC